MTTPVTPGSPSGPSKEPEQNVAMKAASDKAKQVEQRTELSKDTKVKKHHITVGSPKETASLDKRIQEKLRSKL